MNIKLTNKPNETLYIYCRVSTTKQDEDGQSLNVQEERGLKVSKRLGLSPIVIKEQGSGLKPFEDERPLFSDLYFEGICDGKVKNLWTDDLLRLTRHDRDQTIIYWRLQDLGIRYYVGMTTEPKNLGENELMSLMDTMFVRFNQISKREEIQKRRRSPSAKER